MKKLKLKKDVYIYILILIGILGLVYSSYKLFLWHKDNKNNNKIKEEIKEKININEDGKIKLDSKSIKEINSDFVGYLKVKNTNINYPLVKGKNNEYYTVHNFYKEYNKAGWVFVNYLNKLDGSDKNISIFAHNRLDGSMFGTLKKVLNKEWQEDKNNLIIDFTTEDKNNEYQVFSTYKIEMENYYIKSDFNSDREFELFIEEIKKRSNYDYNIDVDVNDQILTLSTCDIDNNYRVVLHAKKIL